MASLQLENFMKEMYFSHREICKQLQLPNKQFKMNKPKSILKKKAEIQKSATIDEIPSFVIKKRSIV